MIDNQQLLDGIKEHFEAQCEPCRRVVLGNGRRPMDSRVSVLEWIVYGSCSLTSLGGLATFGAVVAWGLGYIR